MRKRASFVIVTVIAIASLSSFAVHAAEGQERVRVGDGINAIYRSACQMHCKNRRIDECVRNCFEQYFDAVDNDSDDADLTACRKAGGILSERIGPCAASITKIIDLTDETKLSEMFAAMADVEQRCTSDVLCDAPKEAGSSSEFQP